MSEIKISTGRKFSATVIPNVFIDRFMPDANGTFVKVYLYLLRCQYGGSVNFSTTSAADFLDETEKDIIRALKYWEKTGIINLERDNDEITGIFIVDLSQETPCATNIEFAQVAAIPAVSAIELKTAVSAIEPKASATGTKASSGSAVVSETSTAPEVKTYTREDIDRALTDPAISWLSDIVGGYLEKLLTNTDLSLIMFMYFDLHFSKELILHVYETCVEKNKKSNKYIQAVAINWYEQGITTVEEAEQYAIAFDSYFSAINKSWNLGRLPGDKEQKFINAWKEWGFSVELVKEACDRTLIKAGKPNFKYANGILSNWHDKGYTTLKQVEADDKAGAASLTSPVNSVKNTGTKSAQAYNSYASHTYSGMDMMEIQRQLLRKNRQQQQ